MSVLTELKTRFDSLGSMGLITMGFMPASPDEVGTLYEYGGLLPERQFGLVGMAYETPTLQIMFRGNPYDYETPREHARLAWNSLCEIQPGELGDGITTEYLTATPMQSPFPLKPVDASNRHYIGFNVYITKVPS